MAGDDDFPEDLDEAELDGEDIDEEDLDEDALDEDVLDADVVDDDAVDVLDDVEDHPGGRARRPSRPPRARARRTTTRTSSIPMTWRPTSTPS